MANAREIGITLRVVTTSAKAAVGKFVADSKRQFSALRVGLASAFSGLDKIKDYFTPLNQMFEMFNKISRAASAVAQTVGKWVDAASGQERVEIRLAAALRERGIYSDKLNDSLKRQASLMQSAFGIGDDAIVQIQGTLLAMGVAGDKIESAVRATVGFAQVTGDLGSAASAVAKVYQGKISVLQRYGVQVRSTAEAIAFLAGKFQLAEAQADTLDTKLKSLGQAWGDIDEELGRVFTQSAAAKDGIDALITTTEGLGLTIAWVRDSFGGFDGVLKLAVGTLSTILPPIKGAAGAFAELYGAMFPDLDAAEAKRKAAEQDFKRGIQERSALLGRFDSSSRATGDGFAGLEARLGAFDRSLHRTSQNTIERIKTTHASKLADEASTAAIHRHAEALRMMADAAEESRRRAATATLAPDSVAVAADPTGLGGELIRQREIEGLTQHYENLAALRAEYDAVILAQDAVSSEARFALELDAYDTQQAKLVAKTDATKAHSKQTVDFLASNFSSLFIGALKGGESFINVLDQIASQMLAMGALQIFKTILNLATGGVGGEIFNTIGSLLFASHGGRVPHDLQPRRFAGGGFAVPNTGSDRDVFPALLRRGEYVQTPEERASQGAQQIVVNVATPINTLAIPDRTTVAKQFAAHVVPVLDQIRASGKVTQFSRAVRSR